MRQAVKSICVVTFLSLSLQGGSIQAAPRVETLLPDTTKLLITTHELPAVYKSWQSTSLGKMFAGPELQPFMDQLSQRQDAEAAGQVPPLGLWWEDVVAMAEHSATLAIVPDAKKLSAFVVIVDTTNRAAAVEKIRQRLSADFARRQAKTGSLVVGETKVAIYQYAANSTAESPLVTRYYFERDGYLVVTEREFVVRDLLSRWNGEAKNSLADSAAYQATTALLIADASPAAAAVQFFIDPFGLHAIRHKPAPPAARVGVKMPAKKTAAPDEIEQMAHQGFDMIKGIGGVVTFSQGDRELVFRARIQSPGELLKAAQLLAIEPAKDLDPPAWFPANSATITSVNWKLSRAFAGYGAWFDATDGMGDTGTFDAIVNDIKVDKNSPMVDIHKDVVGILTGPVHAATWIDTKVPAGKASADSHWIYAVKTTNEPLLAESLKKMLDGDGDILKPVRKIGNSDVWVYRADSGETWLGPNLSNVAITAAQGYWIVASDFKTLESVLSTMAADGTLSSDSQWQDTLAGTKALHTSPAAARHFLRLSSSLAEKYALLQAGKIQDDSSLLGQALTAWLDQIAPRKQPVTKPATSSIGAKKTIAPAHDLDFKLLPPFADLQKYLGTFGAETEITVDGWQQSGLISPPVSK